jgi:putative peptidoglycan lipid II flippase
MLSRVGAAQAALYDEEPPEPVSLFDRAKALVATMLPRSGVLLSVLFVAAAAMGLVRDKVLAHQYGAGPDLDAFFTALILPQLILEIIVVGGVVGPFLPLFVGLRDEAEATAREFARTIMTCAVIAMAVAMAILFVFAAQTAAFMAPGYVGEQRDAYVALLRIMCAGQVVFAASYVLGEVLVAERRFLAYGLGDLMYNAGIVVGALLLSGPASTGPPSASSLARLRIWGFASSESTGRASDLECRSLFEPRASASSCASRFPRWSASRWAR